VSLFTVLTPAEAELMQTEIRLLRETVKGLSTVLNIARTHKCGSVGDYIPTNAGSQVRCADALAMAHTALLLGTRKPLEKN
jgi:hypothetical protein